MASCSRGGLVAICAVLSLVGGGTYAFVTNVLLNTPCDSSCSPDTSFRKPWFAAFCVLFLQALANLLAYSAIRGTSAVAARRLDGTAVATTLTPAQAQTVSVFERSMRVPMTVISVLDASTVFLQSLASLYIPAAVNGAMRGTLLLLTALMSRALRIFDGQAGRLEWAGIAVSTLGSIGVGAVHIAAVAFPAVASGGGKALPTGLAETSAADAATGVVLSLLSNVSLALGIAWETKVFEKRKPSMLALNATRTMAGSAIVLIAMAAASVSPPAHDHGVLENGLHTACCVASTPAIAGFGFTIGAGATISGISALYLSALAGSNFRALVYVGRALWVWVLELVTWYGGGALTDPYATVYGQPWNLFSYPMALGFGLVLAGGAMTWRGRGRRVGALRQVQPQAEEEAADSATAVFKQGMTDVGREATDASGNAGASLGGLVVLPSPRAGKGSDEQPQSQDRGIAGLEVAGTGKLD